jgi:hypothetical protein
VIVRRGGDDRDVVRQSKVFGDLPAMAFGTAGDLSAEAVDDAR